MVKSYKCVLILILIHFQCLGAKQYQFKYLTSEDGLANNVVSAITQDKEGFMWFATRDGINCYDGYSFESYNPVELFQNQIKSNAVRKIFCDSKNRIWFSSGINGVAYYDKTTRSQVYFTHKEMIKNSFPSASVTSFYEDKNGNIWIGTSVGLVKYIEVKQQFIVYKHSEYDSKNSDEINCIAEDQTGNLWLGSKQGIYMREHNGSIKKNQIYGNSVPQLNEVHITSIFTHKDFGIVIGTIDGSFFLWDDEIKGLKKYCLQPSNETGPVFDIINDNKGNLWIAYDGGIIVFDFRKRTHSILKYAPNERFSLNNSGVYDLYRDDEGRIWLATYGGGVNIYNPNEYPFNVIQHIAKSSNCITNNTARSIAEDHNGNLWFGTKGGASVLNPKTGKISNFVSESDNETTLNRDIVLSICVDKDSLVWLGNYSGGINLYSPFSNKVTRLQNSDGLYPHNKAVNISVIKEDSKGRIWFGTWGDNLLVLDKEKKEYESYLDSYVNAIYEDSKQVMWVGLQGGFAIFPDSENLDSVIIKRIPSGIGMGKVDDVYTICEGTNGNIWLGTEGGGLIKYNMQDENYTQYVVKDGLSSNFVYGILRDGRDNLWISTSKGISNFNSKKNTFINYTHHDGLPGLEYNYGAYFKTEKGQMVFGGPKGFVLFHPDSLRQNLVKPKVYITGIKFNNQDKISTKKMEMIYKGFYENKEIVIPHNMTSFKIDFIALNYTHSEKNKYALLMEGEIDKWVDWGKQRYINFTGLKAGTYKFRVKACNNNQVWNNEGDSLNIIVLPPFWQTWWAYILYFILAVSSFLLVRKTFLERINLRQSIAFEKKEKKRIQELNQSKISFFTSISHEFRTPLILISGPLERIKRNKGFDDDLQLINRNTQRLLRLINNLLDFRRVDMGSVGLNMETIEFPNLIRSVVDCFEDLVSQKNINLRYTCKLSQKQIIGDYSKLESVLYNIISNSIKYSGSNEIFDINVFDRNENNKQCYLLEIGELKNKRCIQIDIRDYGLGIKEKEISKVFQRFYQAENDVNNILVGSGIGLALVKEFVLMHNGAIKVWSKQNEGTLFSVFLPIENEQNKQAVFSEENTFVLNPTNQETLDFIPEIDSDNEKLLVLLVEDNVELKNFICSCLEKDYRVITAINGRDGLDKILQYNPAIIVSDIMMPEMNGYQLCQHVREDITISHIPIVLISAQTDDESRIQGIDHGADVYIAKPFSMELLSANMNKLIAQRVLLHEKIVSGNVMEPLDGLTNSNQDFLLKNFKLIELYISDTDLNSDSLAEKMNISKSSYYRKIKALTNKVPSELIMHQRMLKAVELLCSSEMNISEVSMAVGFVNAKHFSTRFKKEYNLSPTQYKQKHKA